MRRAEADILPNVGAVARALAETYGRPTLGNKRNPLDELLFIILSSKTPPSRYRLTYSELKRKYPSANDLAAANPKAIATAIAVGGLAEKKASQITAIARRLRKTFGRVTLRPIAHMSDVEAEVFLDELPGIGKKMARCVLMYSLGRQVFPVDAHCFRICQRLGWVAQNSKLTDRVADELQSGIPRKLRHQLHVGMVMLGRELCTPARPCCPACPLLVYCPTGQSRVAQQ